MKGSAVVRIASKLKPGDAIAVVRGTLEEDDATVVSHPGTTRGSSSRLVILQGVQSHPAYMAGYTSPHNDSGILGQREAVDRYIESTRTTEQDS